MGKRQVKEWILNPLKKESEIEERLKAIDELHELDSKYEVIKTFKELFNKSIDMERILQRIFEFEVNIPLFLNFISVLEKYSYFLDNFFNQSAYTLNIKCFKGIFILFYYFFLLFIYIYFFYFIFYFILFIFYFFLFYILFYFILFY